MSARDPAGIVSAAEHLTQHLAMLGHSCQIVDALIPQDELVITGTRLIVDMSTIYHRILDEKVIREKFNSYNINIPWTIVTSDVTYYNKNESNIIYYPIFLIEGILKGPISRYYDIQKPRNNIACFLTYHLHVHRLMVFAQLVKQSWFTKCQVNLLNPAQMTESQLNAYTTGMQFITADEKNQMLELIKMAPITADPDDNQRMIINTDNKSFWNSYVNIFTESDYPLGNFITEKSIKPFLTGQFPAVIANPTVYAHLEELGFDLLSDCINLKTSTLDIRENITNVMHQVTQLEPTIEYKWNETYNRRLHNFNLARSPALLDAVRLDLRTWLTMTCETNKKVL